MPRFRPVLLALGLLLVGGAMCRAEEPFHYPEGEHGSGRLQIINTVPVLIVRGKPEEIGAQTGMLAFKPASALFKQGEAFVKAHGWEQLYPLMLKTGRLMKPRFPPDHLAELEAAARASGLSEDLLTFANTIPDLRKLKGCSVLMVEPGQSATGGMLFGRNVDSFPFGPLAQYTLVTVYRPEGKLAFASVSYPGMVGVFSGMNEKGLALADLTVDDAKDGSSRLDITGVPYILALRRVLEECSTVDQAEKLLRSIKRTIRQNVAICDTRRGVVFEMTPKSLEVRAAEEGVCVCTNHFRSEALATSRECSRYTALQEARSAGKKLDVPAISRYMDAVNQGTWTLQTMVFEPAALKLHLAYGPGPATRLPLRELDLALLLQGRQRSAPRPLPTR